MAVLVLVLAASCTSEPERRDLPDVDLDVSGGAPPGAPPEGPPPPGAAGVGGRVFTVFIKNWGGAAAGAGAACAQYV